MEDLQHLFRPHAKLPGYTRILTNLIHNDYIYHLQRPSHQRLLSEYQRTHQITLHPQHSTKSTYKCMLSHCGFMHILEMDSFEAHRFRCFWAFLIDHSLSLDDFGIISQFTIVYPLQSNIWSILSFSICTVPSELSILHWRGVPNHITALLAPHSSNYDW